jgi:hypothetical protein
LKNKLRRFGVALLSLSALGVLAAAPAQASTDVVCDGSPASQPFKRWLDPFWYVQVPNGGFENGTAGWKLTGGASSAAGNETWRVAGAADSRSLYLPRGASATSPSFCAGLTYPTIRLFTKGGGLPLLSSVRVEAVYTDRGGLLRSTALGLTLPSKSWMPSLPALTLSGLPLLTGSTLAVRLTAVGGSFHVDDVFVDPYSRT